MVRIFCIAVLIWLSAEDIRKLEVSDAGLAALAGAVLAWCPSQDVLDSLPLCVLIGLCHAAVQLMATVFKRSAPYGGADALVFAVLAPVFGAAGLLAVFAVSGMLAGICALVLLLVRKAEASSQIPYIPFITAAAAVLTVSQAQGRWLL